MSSSPARSRGSESIGSAIMMLSSTAGCSSRKRAIASGTIDAAADANDASRSDPPSRPARDWSSTSTSRQPGQDRLAAFDEQPAGVGEHDPLRHSPHEHRSDFGLERGDLPRDRRLGVAERDGRARERALAGDLAENLQTSGVEHDQKLYLTQQTPI